MRSIDRYNSGYYYDYDYSVIYNNDMYIWCGDYTVAGIPGVDENWIIVPEWSETGEYTTYDRVKFDGKWYVVSYTYEEFATVGLNPEENMDEWSLLSVYCEASSPLAYIPYDLQDIEDIEEYMISKGGGTWSGMLPIGDYFLNKRFSGTFDFHGFEINNLYIDRRTSNAIATYGTVSNFCSRTALFATMGKNTLHTDKFLSSRPVLRNPFIISCFASSVLLSHDVLNYSDIGSPDITGGIEITNAFILAQRQIASIAAANMPYNMSGDINVQGTVVCECLSEPAISYMSSVDCCLAH